jgi:hypothetical protein
MVHITVVLFVVSKHDTSTNTATTNTAVLNGLQARTRDIGNIHSKVNIF